ncbi:MAG: elongation factor G [Bacteroidetes bacterium]|nr:elongation factor G [Bacteroidota bacterium]MBU2585106.1 elongation factor G [Bacteroidota bacterium]
MKEYKSKNIRNITLIGHGGSGKTSITESILFASGEITRLGKVEDGNTTSDFKPDEIERQISISAALMHCDWQNNKINIIDTPGYADFIGEVKCGLRVADCAVLVLKAVEGIEVGSDIVWKFADDASIPKSILINKCDNERSNFFEVFNQVKSSLTLNAVVVQYPVNQGINFDTVIDLLKMKQLVYERGGNGKYKIEDIPADKKAEAEKLFNEMVEMIAESDEGLMNKYFENGSLSAEEIQQGIQKGILKGSLVPVIPCGATANVNIAGFLDVVAEYFPSPAERNKIKAFKNGSEVDVEINEENDPALFVFKTLSESAIGELSFFKVYSGTIQHGLDLHNPKTNKFERTSQIYVLNGKHRKEVPHLFAGDLGAVVRLKDTHTNNTLVSKSLGVKFNEIEFPNPIIQFAVKSRAQGDEDKIANGFHTLHEEDPTFKMHFDPELSQTIITGQGELHLNLAAKKLKDKFGVEVDLIEPKIPYRETIKGVCADSEYKHKKQSGGRGQYGHVHLKIEPRKRGEGFEFDDSIVGGVVPGRFIPAVEKGLNDILLKGVLAGYKVVDVKVTLFDGTYHTVDSDEISFKIAAAQAFKKGFLEAKPCLLEPIQEVKITIPEEYMGDVMGDISSRRGKILGMDSSGKYQIIKALVPLAELFKYSTHLRSMTQGRGLYEMALSHYEEVPKEIEAKIIAAAEKEKEEA